jgi:hypothetical protein
MIGDVSFFIDRKSETRWELWYMSRWDGHRYIDSASSPELCMDLITPEKFAARWITLGPSLFSQKPFHWVRSFACA